MIRTSSLLILSLFAGAALGASGFDTTIIPEPPLLREGFVLRGADGRLSGPDGDNVIPARLRQEDAWFFELAEDVNDYRSVLKAGTRLQMLPSSTLERMIADARARSEATFRLWNGRITRYKGRNFLFPSFFLPVRQIAEPEPQVVEQPKPEEPGRAIETPPVQEREPEPILQDPNDVLSIPRDLLQKLRTTRKTMAARERPIVSGNKVAAEPNSPDGEKQRPEPVRYSGGTDSVLIDRTGFLVDDGGGLVFVPDALGQNVQHERLHLLPCEALELAELERDADFEPVRFRVAGILTRYEDADYLLLSKATPVYTHGNFGR